MNMKTHSISYFVLCTSCILLFTGCSDFLSIKPQNDIVLENYWTEEADVNSVLNSCYAQLESSDCVNRMIVWGEVRSDNMTTGSGTSYALQQVFKENILETNTFSNWQSFYQCINRCNTVIHYAPIVNAKDPNFTDSEMRATIAEATTLRALCYFYLIRTFRDVPYTETCYEDDSEDEGKQQMALPATDFNTVLSNLIYSLEEVKEDALEGYPETSNPYSEYFTTGRITKWAIYSMLCEMYLWQKDYVLAA